MIKIVDLNHFVSIKEAQNHIFAHSNYIVDVLAPAVERGDWNKFEQLDIGFNITGESLGKIGDNDAWKKIQPIFEPYHTQTNTLDFTLNGQIIERNLQNQLKAVILKMIWISQHYYSMSSIVGTLNQLKKLVLPLLEAGYNSFEHLDFNLLDKWVLSDSTDIEFERIGIYIAINKLFTESRGLPFRVAVKKKITAKDFGVTLKEEKQFNVIPQRLFYLGLKKSEELINYFYPLRDELDKLSTYLFTYFDILYKNYAKYLVRCDGEKNENKSLHWHLDASNKNSMTKIKAFKKAFMNLSSPTEAEVFKLLKIHKPEIETTVHNRFHPKITFKVAGRKVSGFRAAENLFTEINGGCMWGMIARSGMRLDELFHLHTTMGCRKETISKQNIYVLSADLSKTVKGIQSKQVEFVTTETSKKAYEILQALHMPLRKFHPDSTSFFSKYRGGAIKKKPLSKQYQNWFDKTLGEELILTKEDIVDLKVSDPKRSFKVGEEYKFSGHQLRRSFAYYLIGYELLSFPQLKQQFSHISLAMTRFYAQSASKFQKLRKEKQNLLHSIDEERIVQKAKVYLNIFKKLANKERVAGGKGKEFAKNMMKTERNLFKDKVDNDMLSLNYWKKQIRDQKRHIHAVAPGVYCTSTGCSLRTQVNLMECVDCKNDYIVDAVFAEAKRKEAEIHMLWDIEHDELTPQTASEAYIKITAAERIMNDLGIEYESVKLPPAVQEMLIPYIGVPV